MSTLTTDPQLFVAARVAAFFSAMAEVRDVFAFGSRARGDGEDGSDLDLIVTSYGDITGRFFDRVIRDGSSLGPDADPYIALSGTRFHAFMTTLGMDREERDELLRLLLGIRLDVFMMPDDWQNRLDELQTVLPHRDPHFMANLGREARRYNPQTGVFDPS